LHALVAFGGFEIASLLIGTDLVAVLTAACCGDDMDLFVPLNAILNDVIGDV
jgi:hypothetical protein